MRSESNCEVLGKHLVVIMQKRYHLSFWFKLLLKKMTTFYKQVHPHKMATYAQLITCFLEEDLLNSNTPKFELDITLSIDFIKWALFIEFDRSGTPYNKLIRTKDFTIVFCGVKLLNTLLKCFLKEKEQEGKIFILN